MGLHVTRSRSVVHSSMVNGVSPSDAGMMLSPSCIHDLSMPPPSVRLISVLLLM